MNTVLAFDASPGLPPKASARVREPAPAIELAAVSAKAASGWSGPRRPRSCWLLVAGLHLVGGWALAHSLVTPAVKTGHDPIQVRVIAPPPPPPPPRVEVPAMKLPAVPLVAVIPPPQIEVTATVVAVPAPVVAAALPVAAAPASTAAPASVPAATVSTAPRQLPPSAVRYLVPPRPVMPRMSRRLGEAGIVVLRIAVDAQGRLKSVAVKKSSGFERLDQQAMLDMRGASFAPYLEQGQPVEWEADAGIQYELSAH